MTGALSHTTTLIRDAEGRRGCQSASSRPGVQARGRGAGVEPRFVEWDGVGGSPTEWVVSKNLHRRHLTTGQRAALALDLLPRLEAEAKERQREHGGTAPGRSAEDTSSDSGRSDERAAALVGVGRTTVATAKAIQKRDEDGARP